ncbi:MAG: hypothetical protein K2X01_06695 [Cyanobacteria bacterium]|nr:hypothetical protein [Cyanobacteriota bacterium]
MPPQIAALLQNRNAMIGIIAGSVLLLVLMLVWHPWSTGPEKGGGTLKPNQRTLATVETIGRAIEVQALLAREGIRLDRKDADGGKATLEFQEMATQEDRDRALITLVQSGLMDKNVGLEAFDKGDLTASREEKRIKLIRAQQGELARLIRKIEPIEEASVSLSIPEPTIFRSQQKAMSASIQVTIPTGERLTRDKVRSIINLIVGSIQGLEAAHVALSDTNGNTYSSVLDSGAEMMDRLEEQDQYMKQKVSSQLDRLIGAGHYVVTVSTQLRESPRETMVQSFDPNRSVVTNKQSFTERLNARSASRGGSGGATSSYLPSSMQSSSGGGDGNSNRGYTRDGVEVNYANTKTQWMETNLPGVTEDISIAVTVDRQKYPQSLSLAEFQQLIARAASPKVQTDSVSIAQIDFSQPSLVPLNKAGEQSEFPFWLLWVLGGAILIVLLLIMMTGGRGGNQTELLQTRQEVQQLRDFAAQQQAQLQATQQQTQTLLELQQKQPVAAGTLGVGDGEKTSDQSVDDLRKTLADIQAVVAQDSLDDEDFDRQIQSWIEST